MFMLLYANHVCLCDFLTQKTKRSPKVEVGTGTTDANMDEWLEVNINLLHPKDGC